MPAQRTHRSRGPCVFPDDFPRRHEVLEVQPPAGWSGSRGCRHDGHARGLPSRCIIPRGLLAGPPGAFSDPVYRLAARSHGKQPYWTAPVAPIHDRGVRRCVSGHIPGHRWKVENSVGFRQAGWRRSLVEKDLLYDRTGGEVTANAAPAVVKHPLPISPSRDSFALYSLCQVDPRSALAARSMTCSIF